MAKSITVAQQLALEAAHHAEALFIEADYDPPNAPLRYTTAGVTMTWNSQTWVGGVSPAAIEPIRETEQSEAVGLKITLSGVPTALRSAALAYHVQSKRLTIWVAPMNVSTYTLEGTPIKEFEGLIDVMEIADADDGTLTITIEVESKMARLLRANVLRYTDRDHQQRHPGDTICRHTSQTEKTVVWPSKGYFLR